MDHIIRAAGVTGMRLTINGEPRSFEPPLTVDGLLGRIGRLNKTNPNHGFLDGGGRTDHRKKRQKND